MKNYPGRMILLIEDYEKARSFYENNFGFKKIYDVTTDAGQRFLHMGSDSTDKFGIWFLKAESKEQKERIGNQTAGQPTLVIYTTSLDLLNKKLNENKIRFISEWPVQSDPTDCHTNLQKQLRYHILPLRGVLRNECLFQSSHGSPCKNCRYTGIKKPGHPSGCR